MITCYTKMLKRTDKRAAPVRVYQYYGIFIIKPWGQLSTYVSLSIPRYIFEGLSSNVSIITESLYCNTTFFHWDHMVNHIVP